MGKVRSLQLASDARLGCSADLPFSPECAAAQ